VSSVQEIPVIIKFSRLYDVLWPDVLKFQVLL